MANRPVAEFSIRAGANEVRQASDWLERSCSGLRVPADAVWRLDVCLNEALANVIAYGGSLVFSDTIKLLLEVKGEADSGEAAVTVSDAGAAFNPLDVPQRDRPVTLDDATPGGLGLPMMRAFADQLSYRYADGHNHLIFTVRWNAVG